jgi:glutamyl-tRNA reductase
VSTREARVRPLRAVKVRGERDREVELWLVGLNHQTAPVELRERLAIPEDKVAEQGRKLVESGVVQEATVLTTCNRVEVVAVAASGRRDVASDLTAALARESGLAPQELLEHCYVHRGKLALRHLFRVAASLDSMMVGESQILGQVKQQFRLAVEAGAAAKLLRRCFERSFTVAKRVRSETGVAAKAVSISSAAVELARRIFDGLEDKTAMLIGAGKMAELAARHLLGQGIASVIVTNRSFDRAVDLARAFGGTPVPFDRFVQYLHLADVVLGSVTAAGYMVGPSQLTEVMRARRRRPMFFIDLGVPRNFDPAVNDLEGVYLYNIDDLASVADDHRTEREREAVRAESIVDEEVERFWPRLAGQDLTPTIVALREKFHGIGRGELERALRALKSLEPAERAALEAMTQAIVNKILHLPLAALKELATSDDGDAALEATELIHQLFALELEEETLDDGEEAGPR